MSDVVFGVLWVAAASVGLTVGLRRFRRHGTIRPIEPSHVRPELAATASRIELGMWLVFLLGGVIFLIVALAR